ncbi:MAG: ABC transporter ATP-binding protein [Planctomycetes bacterium]|nr:ABC transporter ATP-binding protein [Planctomycetota bacterium]
MSNTETRPESDQLRIRCEQVSKRMPSGGREITILESVDLQVAAGEFCAILGRSGSGKSTLLGLMAGLDRPSSGEVFIDGSALTPMNETQLALMRRHRIGIVFQSFHLLSNLTARENILMPMELIGTTDAARRSDELLESVGLSARGHHYPSQLSGGEQQRVALARAFAPRPAILLADEPTGNLDAETGAQVLDLLCALRDREGTTLVLVTHDDAVAARAERRIHLERGRVVREESRV